MPSYKIILAGDGGVGKTTLVQRHSTGQFNNQYIPTLGVEVKPLLFNTNYGPITFDIWDTAGQEKFNGLGIEAYAIGANAIIVMCAVTSKTSATNLNMWYNKLKQQGLPIVVCGNKYDIDRDRHKLTQLDKLGLKEIWGMYYDISVKSNYNFEKPFLYLARKLSGHNDLVFIPHPGPIPPCCSDHTTNNPVTHQI